MPVATAPLVPITGLDLFEIVHFLTCLAIGVIPVTITSNSLWLGKDRAQVKAIHNFFCNQSYWIYRFIQDKVVKSYKINY